MRYAQTLLFFLCCHLLTSCDEVKSTLPVAFITTEDKFDVDAFADEMSTTFDSLATATDSMSVRTSVSEALFSLYAANDFQPLWLRIDSTSVLADSLCYELAGLQSDGLQPERYQTQTLQQWLQEYKSQKAVPIEEVIRLDTALTHGYLQASKDLLFGRIVPKKADSLWFHRNDSTWKIQPILQQLKQEAYPSLSFYRSKLTAYSILQKAWKHYDRLCSDTMFAKVKETIASNPQVSDSLIEAAITLEAPWLQPISDTLIGIAKKIQSFQQYVGIKRTGKLDSVTRSYLLRQPSEVLPIITANLERLRWLPQQFEKDHIVVNIPTMNFSFRRGDEEVMYMNVVVGKSSRQTPTLHAFMSNIVINPSWGVPPTIAKNDVMPGLLRTGERYLRKKGLEVFDHKGKKVDASVVTMSNYKRYVFRQPPGHSNALGYVKFNFPNKWDIYMHDTPHREDFDNFDRALSSGCVRLQKPKELAVYILSEIEQKRFQESKLDSMIKGRKTTYEVLQHKIPVHIIYLTAWQDADGENVRLARDFYRRDKRLMEMLSK